MPTYRTDPSPAVSTMDYWKTRDQNYGLTAKGILVGKQPVQCVLSAADIIAMNATPVTVVAAPSMFSLPSANLVLLPTYFTFQFIYPSSGGVQFTGGGAISINYAGTSVSPFQTIAASVVTAAASSINVAPPVGAAFAPTQAVGLTITNATAAFAAGNGTAIVTVFYDILLLG